MKILYTMLALCIFTYADNFKEILLLQINDPYVLDSYRNDEIAVAYCKKGNVDYFTEKILLSFLKKLKSVTM